MSNNKRKIKSQFSLNMTLLLTSFIKSDLNISINDLNTLIIITLLKSDIRIK